MLPKEMRGKGILRKSLLTLARQQKQESKPEKESFKGTVGDKN
jgi:hypothetical protein